MRDEIESRLWTEHGATFTAAVRDLLDQVRIAFLRLNARTWDAPWRVTEERACRDM